MRRRRNLKKNVEKKLMKRVTSEYLTDVRKHAQVDAKTARAWVRGLYELLRILLSLLFGGKKRRERSRCI